MHTGVNISSVELNLLHRNCTHMSQIPALALVVAGEPPNAIIVNPKYLALVVVVAGAARSATMTMSPLFGTKAGGCSPTACY